jgi:MFS family permease
MAGHPTLGDVPSPNGAGTEPGPRLGEPPLAAPATAASDPYAAPIAGPASVPAATSTMPLPSTRLVSRMFESLHHRDFRIFYVGQLISVIGTWMQSVAQGWLVLTLTGSPFLLGVASAVRTVPILLLAVPAGIAADRFDRRGIVIAANTLMLAMSAALAILTLTGAVTFGWVLVLAIGLGIGNAFEMPTRQSMVVQLTGPRHLPNAIALNSLLFNGARVVGPALGGLIVAVAGPGVAFAINAASFVPVLVGLAVIHPQTRERSTARARGAVTEAFRYLRRERRVALLLALLAANTIFASGYVVLGPALAEELGQGPEGLGLVLSAAGVGAVAGGLRLAAVAGRGSQLRILVVAGIALGVGLVLLPFAGSFALTLALMLVVGWGMVTYSATSNTVIQTIVPDLLRGRIMSLYTVVMIGLLPIGSLILGALADRYGTALALGVGGALWAAIVGLAFAGSERLRTL